jgi:hypothetical protein
MIRRSSTSALCSTANDARDRLLPRHRNYSQHFPDGCRAKRRPLLDYLPQDSIMFIDESHQTIPQLPGMYHEDARARGAGVSPASGCPAPSTIAR